ncbi:MAG: efflux RND transporter periplasmic adaptor subunit [Gammaproteobacteria bacterium]|nr:efflux RND transporter periplasmic adaptor subunit [Gammaproteobacteria bacterium]
MDSATHSKTATGNLLPAWHALQCTTIPGIVASELFIGTTLERNSTPVSTWPVGAQRIPELQATASKALAKNNPIIKNDQNDDRLIVAYPIAIDNVNFGVIAVQLESQSEQQQRAVVALLHWGASWLELLLAHENDSQSHSQHTILELLATTLETATLIEATAAVAAELARGMNCDHVYIGLLRGQQVKLDTISNSTNFDGKSNLVLQIESAMHEAIDQDAGVAYPATSDAEHIAVAHAELSKAQQNSAVCTVPIGSSEGLFGAVTCERPGARPFDDSSIELLEAACSLIGPVLAMKRAEQHPLAKLINGIRHSLHRLFGPEHFGFKLVAASLTAAVIVMSVASGDYRVSGTAYLEGTVQRVVVAPMDGFIDSATARAGDLVRAGETLGQLDSKSLKLERLRWSGLKAQRLGEYREAMANHDRAQTRILSAQVEQAQAQIQLLDERLSRTQLLAPFDGIIVSGDLSQRLGSPVERGAVLFEVAPLDSYRVIVEVDETEISEIAVGDEGELALSALPGEIMPIRIEKISPLSTAEDRRNFFRVEARLEGSNANLRPGMMGVGKIAVDTRKLIWIWTHSLFDWLSFWIWTWWP